MDPLEFRKAQFTCIHDLVLYHAVCICQLFFCSVHCKYLYYCYNKKRAYTHYISKYTHVYYSILGSAYGAAVAVVTNVRMTHQQSKMYKLTYEMARDDMIQAQWLLEELVLDNKPFSS